MPTAITIRLRPDHPGLPDTRQVHGLACSLFESDGAHTTQRKPFTVWPITLDPVDPEVGLLLRASWLPDIPVPFDPGEVSKLRLGSRFCAVVSVDHHEVPRAVLASGPVTGSAEIVFRSPVYFAANSRRTIAPDLRLILGGYRRRWNEDLPEDSPLRIGDDLGRELQQAAEFRSYELHTRQQDGGHGHPVTGFTGRISLGMPAGTPTETMSAFGALLRFAPYTGTGARTTHGFGATSVVLPTPIGAA